MISARAIATLGVGYGPAQVARLGLWPQAAPSPGVLPGGGAGGRAAAPVSRGRNRRLSDEEILILTLL